MPRRCRRPATKPDNDRRVDRIIRTAKDKERRPGNGTGADVAMKRWLAAMAALFTMTMAGAAQAGSVTLFSEPGFRGDRITIRGDIDNLAKLPPWNERARSLIVNSGTWEVCKNKRYEFCRTLAAGARVAETLEVKNLRGGISSLRQIDDRNHWDDDRRDRDPWGRWDAPPPLPPPPPRYRDDDIIWNGGGGGGRQVTNHPQNACQSQVESAFIQRHGYRGRTEFTGDAYEGTIWWDGEPWRYRCSGGQINIWK